MGSSVVMLLSLKGTLQGPPSSNVFFLEIPFAIDHYIRLHKCAFSFFIASIRWGWHQKGFLHWKCQGIQPHLQVTHCGFVLTLERTEYTVLKHISVYMGKSKMNIEC